MAILTINQDIVTDTEFFAFNDRLNAGDKLTGSGANDTLFFSADDSLGNVIGRSYAAFQLISVENFDVVNDSLNFVAFDLSSSTGLQAVSVSNSSEDVRFQQVANLVNLAVIDTTDSATVDVDLQYQDSVVAGANDSMSVTVNSTDAARIRIGRVGDDDNGIEIVNLTTVGDSVINQLDTDLTTLNINGGGNVNVVQALNTTVRTITSTGSGNVDLSWANNGAAAGVVYTGSMTGTGVDDLLAGAGNDNITTFGGNDIIDGRAGNDTINAGEGDNVVRTGTGANNVTTGGGADQIFAQGASDVVSSGGGNDVVDITAGGSTVVNAGEGSDLVIGNASFNAANVAGGDTLNMGGGYDALQVNAGLTDVNFTNVTGLEALTINTSGVTQLGGGAGPNNRAQLAGLDSIFLISGGNDTVDASTFTSSLVVRSFGNAFNTGGVGTDIVTTGSGVDQFLWYGDNNLDNTDRIDGGAAFDILVLEGDTNINGASFKNIEFLFLESARPNPVDGRDIDPSNANTYNITLTDANAPSLTSAALFIDGSNLQADTDGAGPLGREDATISSLLVTTYVSSITTGNGFDTVTSGMMGDAINTNGGDDVIRAGGGNDVIQSGDGDDLVLLQAGNNFLDTGSGDNDVLLGSGNDIVASGTGNDTVYSLGNANGLQGFFAVGTLSSADILTDSGGRDTLKMGQENIGDAAFTNVRGFEVIDLELSGSGVTLPDGGGYFGFGFAGTLTIGSAAQTAGIDTVIGSDQRDVIDAQAFTRDLTIDLSRGGNDFAISGSGNDLFIAGNADQFVSGGSGNDRLQVSGSQLTLADGFAGGAGSDTIVLDNRTGGVVAQVNLALVSSVENYAFLTGGDRTPVSDPDNSVITFANAAPTTVTTVTTINVDGSTLTDVEDTLTVVLDVSLGDADFAFNIFGSASGTVVDKQNFGVNNNINFQGGAGTDTFVISGGDLGSTTIFNGGAGMDVITQVAGGPGLGQGLLTDDSFISVSNVEILAASVGSLNATLGASAAASGLMVVAGNSGNDNVLLSAAFTAPLTFIMGGAGNDTFNAAASAAAMTFIAVDSELNAADAISGGSSAGDSMQITATGGVSDATTVTGVETITYVGDGNPLAAAGSTLTVDTTLADVNGGTQTINAGALDTLDVFTLNGGTATANLNVTSGAGNDTITTGNGNDTVIGGAGNDRILTGQGTDTVNGGLGNDTIYGGRGNDILNGNDGVDVISGDRDGDTIDGGAGNDVLRGDSGIGSVGDTADTINGGTGNDQIMGGLGADVLDGGAGADIFFYRNRSDSTIIEGKDIINNFESGTDKIDARGVIELTGTPTYTAASTINFAGNFATFGDAQSAITALDGIFDVVYQQDTNTLWFDLNDDGTLNGDDLQITVNTTGVLDQMTDADVYDGSLALSPAPLAAFDALFF